MLSNILVFFLLHMLAMKYLYKCNIFLDISMTSPLLPLHVAGRSELFYEYILRKKMFVFQDKSEKIL